MFCVVIACLWAGEDAVASHDTALAVYGLTDAMPAQIHITTPRPFRGKRLGVIVHVAPLPHADRTSREGVPVTAVARTIADIAVRSGSRMASEAAAEALARGLVTRRRLGQALSSGAHDARAVLAALGEQS